MTLRQRLALAAQQLQAVGIPADEARTEVRLVAQHTLGLTREQLFLRQDDPLPENTDQLEALLARRAGREPLAYLLGEREFYGLRFRVTPAVLIPRPETELLVERTIAHSPRTIADIGTGSGCIAIALAHALPEANVVATDISPEALAIARENAARYGDAVRFFLGDLLAPLPVGERFDAIVSNPPYIPPADAPTLEPEVGQFEPALALFGGDDGLVFYCRLADTAPERLNTGGKLLVEVGAGQADAVAALWEAAGLRGVTITPDLAGIARVVEGTH